MITINTDSKFLASTYSVREGEIVTSQTQSYFIVRIINIIKKRKLQICLIELGFCV